MTKEEIKAAKYLKKVFLVFKKSIEVLDIIRDNQEHTQGEKDMIELHDKMLIELDKENVDFQKISDLLLSMENQADANKNEQK